MILSVYLRNTRLKRGTTYLTTRWRTLSKRVLPRVFRQLASAQGRVLKAGILSEREQRKCIKLLAT